MTANLRGVLGGVSGVALAWYIVRTAGKDRYARHGSGTTYVNPAAAGCHWLAFALLAGMQLDLFTPIDDEEMTAEELAARLGVDANRLSRLLYALAAKSSS